MRRGEFAGKTLALILCAALTAPVVSLGTEPLRAEASAVQEQEKTKETPKQDSEAVTEAQPISDADRQAAASEVEQYYLIRAKAIEEAGNKEAAEAAKKEKIDLINAKAITSKEMLVVLVTEAKTTFDALAVKAEEPDPTPATTNSNVMVGGNWVTPVANAGKQVNVVLPVVNMGRTRVKNVVVTPQISSDASKWPFEIETSNYTQTIDRLPGTDEGGSDMDRRRELTWTLKTRKDAPSGYMPLLFDLTFENEQNALTTATLTTYVKVVGTTGVSADGTTSTPRVIVTGFSTDPEVVHAGETFTLTLHMQNTSKATAVKNMLFDIQAASESTDTNYVAAAFLPTAGSSTIFVDRIAPGATQDISMELEARSDLAQKPYVVNVKMNYEDESVHPYENTASVSIPVRQEARVDISSIDVMPEFIEVGSEANVMFSLYNIGKTRLYNTSVKFVADSVSGGDAYLGNVDPGATSNVDVYLSGAAATMDDGLVKIEITFEDEAGEKTTIEKEMTLFVNEMMYPDDMDMMDDGMMDEGMEPQGGFRIWYVILPLVLIAAAVVAVVVIRKKKKKKEQELLEEDDLGLEEVDLSDDKEEK